MRSNFSSSLPGKVDPAWRIGVVYSSYYKEETGAMVQAALQTLEGAGINPTAISLHPAAGSFEIPLIGAVLAREKKVDGLIALGIIVQGATKHADLLASAVARGIMDVQVQQGIPFAFEILYVPSLDLARARTGGEGNKGKEAALAVLHSLAEIQRIRAS